MAKNYAEYSVDPIPGLVLTGGWQYYGRQAENNDNVAYVGGYGNLNVGLRYAARVSGTQGIIFRVGVNNVTNAQRWITGNGIGGTYEGPPRTVMGSVEAKLF